MKKVQLMLGEVYKYIEPGPVILLATRGEKNNIMTQSWLTMMDFEPPLIGMIVSNRNFSFETLRATKECTINIPSSRLIQAVVNCGNSSGRKVNKFEKFKLTAKESQLINAPIIQECFANFECKVIDMKLANKYNFFVVEVIRAHIDSPFRGVKTLHHMGEGLFMISGRKVQTRSKMK